MGKNSSGWKMKCDGEKNPLDPDAWWGIWWKRFRGWVYRQRSRLINGWKNFCVEKFVLDSKSVIIKWRPRETREALAGWSAIFACWKFHFWVLRRCLKWTAKHSIIYIIHFCELQMLELQVCTRITINHNASLFLRFAFAWREKATRRELQQTHKLRSNITSERDLKECVDAAKDLYMGNLWSFYALFCLP